jgi:hypothetical protein
VGICNKYPKTIPTKTREIVDPDPTPEEISDLIADGAKAGVKVEYSFVAQGGGLMLVK